MADSSNKFSIRGISRQKNNSGLHAFRPENKGMYFYKRKIKSAPQFVSILQVNVTSPGYNYSKNTTLTFSQPQHPSGVPASGYPLFNITKNSFNITNNGSNYSIGDVFSINLDGETIGVLSVTATGVGGSISNYNAFSDFLDFKTTTSLPVVDLSDNPTASIVNNDKYDIYSAFLFFPGLGYQTHDRITGSGINHSPTVSNAGSSAPQPSGLVLTSSLNPYVMTQTNEDPRLRYTKTNKFGEILQENDKKHYFIMNNFSLGDFLS